MAKAWDKTEAPQSERKDIERLKLDEVTIIRLLGDVEARYVYWITTNEGGAKPVECLSFDREKEEFNDSLTDPMSEVPDHLFDGKSQFAYVCNVIDRKDGKVKLFDIKKTIYNQIIKYAQKEDYGNPADVKTGYDIEITRVSTGPKRQNVRYDIMPARTSKALSEIELALELYDLPVILKRPTAESQKEWLIKNTSYFMGAENSDLSPDESAEDL